MTSEPVSAFGALADGRKVEAVRLQAPSGLSVEVLTWGATVRSLRAPSPQGQVEAVLQLATLHDYEVDDRYLNTVIGRCANRIGGAAFELDGQRYRLEANEGANTLHGGRAGWHKRLWRLDEASSRRCTLSYVSPDGEGGFPGQVRASVQFELIDDATLQIAWSAECERPTPVNLTHHLYFSLSNEPDHIVLDDRLTVASDFVTPVGEGLIPTGERRAVASGPLDLREPTAIRTILQSDDPQIALGGGVDLNWILQDAHPRPSARLSCPATGLSMSLSTDQPALQVYTGQGLAAPFARYGALVLEPQGYPDAPNQPSFPTVFLQPGERYTRFARYRFDCDRRESSPVRVLNQPMRQEP